jgi:hypothetical protein
MTALPAQYLANALRKRNSSQKAAQVDDAKL